MNSWTIEYNGRQYTKKVPDHLEVSSRITIKSGAEAWTLSNKGRVLYQLDLSSNTILVDRLPPISKEISCGCALAVIVFGGLVFVKSIADVINGLTFPFNT